MTFNFRDRSLSAYSFSRFYWTCLKHFGVEIFRSGRTEIWSSVGVTVIVFLLSLLVGDAGAKLSLVIALIANACWLALFAVYHLVRSPWLVHRKIQEADVNERHWAWGILGILMLLLMVAGGTVGGFWLYAISTPKNPLVIGYVAPTEKDAEITQLRQTIRDLEQRGPQVITHTLPAPEPEKRCWVSNHFGMPNSTIKGAVTATAAIIHCTYKIDAPFRVAIEFDRDFIPGALVLPDSGMMMGGAEVKQGKTFLSQVMQPPLLREQLAIVTVYGPTDQYPRAVRASMETLK